MIDFDNQTDTNLDITLLESIAAFLSPREVELILLDDEAMRKINQEHRGIDKSTDVLSFPLEGGDFLPLGSILLSIDRVRAEAELRGHSIEAEAALLFIHGMLHLLGYDHEYDQGEQRLKEEELITRFGLPSSLIVRTEES